MLARSNFDTANYIHLHLEVNINDAYISSEIIYFILISKLSVSAEWRSQNYSNFTDRGPARLNVPSLTGGSTSASTAIGTLIVVGAAPSLAVSQPSKVSR